LDGILRTLYANKVQDISDIRGYIQEEDIKNLLNLWNIVFCRGGKQIELEWFHETLSLYLYKYINLTELTDPLSGKIIQELPINLIMRSLGYDGILASDFHNNKWNRGCVSFNYEQASIIQGNRAAYSY